MTRKAAWLSLSIFGIALFGIGWRLWQPAAIGFATKGKFGGTLQRTSLSPTNWSVKVNGIAEIAGVGRGQMEIVHENVGLVEGDTPNLAPNAPIGSVTFTAPNGDKLLATYQWLAAPAFKPNVLSIVGTIQVTGGTGQFADASGHGISVGQGNVSTNFVSITFEGFLDLPRRRTNPRR
jgi:hypothetical protein